MSAASVSEGSAKPVVLLPACNRMMGSHLFHMAGKKYADAVRLTGCMSLIVPPVQPDELDVLLDIAHGVLLTGSQSNVHPSHFDEEVLDPSLPLDPDRDAWTLPIVRKAVARGMPLFAICRGFQEANVALGGTLHQAVHALPGHDDHRASDDAPVEVQYGPAHDVRIEPGGLLADILGSDTIGVNSAHGQGVNRLAPGLRVEARARDGLIEAFSVPTTQRGFHLCVQWHPEWQAAGNPVSLALFRAFGEACRNYRDRHRGPEPRA